ncbi:probable F-box protein At1g44080 [Cicer arietinum]|uniref:F-box protein SKIP23-like n=1 Tax=Cicer arietinum TaxID=3827 RepID=A0A1S2XIT1_CICAR|nr:F-box protein SKIP23-like [Cicer arietinum]
MDRDWANLESLALDIIISKLIEPIDHIWFGSVCKNWHSIAKLNHLNNYKFRNNILPMLMIPSKKNPRKRSPRKRSLFSISANRVYEFQLTVFSNKRVCGSTHGWIATVDKNNVITLVNPFKDVAPIILPRIDVYDSYKYYEFDVRKVTLSVDPITNPNDYVVAAIYTNRGCLAFMKAGQEFWTYMDDIDNRRHTGFVDVAFYKDLVYAVSRWKSIVSFDLCYSTCPYRFEERIPNFVREQGENETYSSLAYLVTSLEGDLWMVRRFVDTVYPYVGGTGNNGTQSFQVFKLELDCTGEKLINMIKLETLGDNVLFLGGSDSTSISASYFSCYVQKNSIYYTDNYIDDTPVRYPQVPYDMGIYNVKDGSFGIHCPFKPYFKGLAPPVWVLPPFQWDC